jgi:hypothetical protein
MNQVVNAFPTNLLCFSHLRWNFVYQRPQLMLNRFANFFKVYFLKEPVFDSADSARIVFTRQNDSLYVGVPHLPEGMDKQEISTHTGQCRRIYTSNRNRAEINEKDKWLAKADKFLEYNSWNITYQNMHKLVVNAVHNKNNISVAS